jgi:hypothetical protein
VSLDDLTARASSWAAAAAAWWAAWGNWVIAGAVVAVLAVAVTQAQRHARAWRDRRSLALVPSSQFDPTMEEILRFAAHLAGVRRAASRWTPNATRTTRITLTSASEGRMAYLVDGTAPVEELLRQRPYAQVDLATPTQIGAHTPATAQVTGPAAEDDSPLQLEHLELDTDPLEADLDEVEPAPAEGDDTDDDREVPARAIQAPVPAAAGPAMEPPAPGSDKWVLIEHTESQATGDADGGAGDRGDWTLEHPEELAVQGRWHVLEDQW